MKYLQLASVSTPAAVSTWFQDELVNRGVDAAYTYYVLSLLKEPDDDQYHYGPSANAKTPHPQAVRPERRRLLAKRCAIECLKSAADSNEEFDALVEELLVRLEPTENGEADRGERPDPLKGRGISAGDDRRRSEIRERVDIDREPKTLAERAKKYFDAFPALQVDERPLHGQRAAKAGGNEAAEGQGQQVLSQVVPRDRKRRRNKRKSPPSAPNLGDAVRELAQTDRGRPKDWPARWVRSPEHPKVRPDVRAEPSRSTGARTTSTTNEAEMGSIMREETLLSRLTQKFDSKLAAIWADVPTVDDQSSLWKISLDLSLSSKSGGRTGCERNCDEVIFSIPNLSIFSKILEDDDDFGNKNTKSQYGSSDPSADLALSPTPHPPSPPTICLKNSTLNYDKDKTAFTEVSIPTRKLGPGARNLPTAGSCSTGLHSDPLTQYSPTGGDVAGSGAAVATAVVNGNSTSADDDGEDLLISPRTHFMPIRVEPEPINLDDERRPPSSSLAELTSYHLLLPEPPKRQQQQLHHSSTSTTSIASTAKSSVKTAIVSVSNVPVTGKQQRSTLKQQKLLLQQQQQQLLNGVPTTNGGTEKVMQSQKKQQQVLPMTTAKGDAVLTAATAAVGASISGVLCAVTPADGTSGDEAGGDQRDRRIASQQPHQQFPLRQIQSQTNDLEKEQKNRSLTTAAATMTAARPMNTVSVACIANAGVMESQHSAPKCVATLDDEGVRALWKMMNFTVPQAPTIDGDADVLGVAHCWRSTRPALATTPASNELRDEIREEEEELFRDIFLEARALQALQASQEAQQQRMARLHEQRMQQRREQLQDNGDQVSVLGSRDGREVTESSTIVSSAGGYNSVSYHDCSLEFGQLSGYEDGGGTADLGCTLGYSEDACGVPIEYLSHFSSEVTMVTPATSCLFASPEVYDSAIVSSVRCIQDLQRRRQRGQRKPCTFYMEGNCRRTDCKFSHELAAITCRFWEEGSCFKGLACPFLHGYAPFEEERVNQAGQGLSTASGASTAGGEHGHHQQGIHFHPPHHHNHQHPRREPIGHVAKRTSKFTIGGGGLSGVFCCGSLQPSSPCVDAILKGRNLYPPFAVAGAAGLRVFTRRRPVFKRLWPHFKESEQDFPSLCTQKSGSHLRTAVKKNLKKTNGIVPKKAKKKKKKSSPSSTESKEPKDSNNNSGQADKEKKKEANPAILGSSNANTAINTSSAAIISTATI
ncbi:hypothetical protein BIW11_07951 [Tropilaelaps mercedesae]|uniref:C3H1-type domain-containing protein n=1 Tax=Tropilaelaps mercedesae TaxID=418985 RepID=A0A1V9XRP3_9ACAR|nr:hypothetical protein BIW11_07951 [Tropilaelaps mercedesae]